MRVLAPPCYALVTTGSWSKYGLGTYCVLRWLAASQWWTGMSLPAPKDLLPLYLRLTRRQETGLWILKQLNSTTARLGICVMSFPRSYYLLGKRKH